MIGGEGWEVVGWVKRDEEKEKLGGMMDGGIEGLCDEVGGGGGEGMVGEGE